MRIYDGRLLEELRDFQVIMMSGLPGVGKSYLARKMVKWFGAIYLSSDVLRRSLLSGMEEKYLKSEGEYLDTRSEVYSRIQKRMMQGLRKGRKVVVDATLLAPQREQMLSVLRNADMISEAVVVLVRADDGLIRHRIQLRKRQALDPEEFEGGWERAYRWFTEGILKGEMAYPSEAEGVRVIELWNE